MQRIEDMQSALKLCFEESTGIPFMWENTNPPLLQKPYGVLSFGQSIAIGRDQYGYTFRDSNITLSVSGHREITVTCQGYSHSQQPGKRARDILETARLMLAHPLHRERLSQAGLVFVEQISERNPDPFKGGLASARLYNKNDSVLALH